MSSIAFACEPPRRCCVGRRISGHSISESSPTTEVPVFDRLKPRSRFIVCTAHSYVLQKCPPIAFAHRGANRNAYILIFQLYASLQRRRECSAVKILVLNCNAMSTSHSQSVVLALSPTVSRKYRSASDYLRPKLGAVAPTTEALIIRELSHRTVGGIVEDFLQSGCTKRSRGASGVRNIPTQAACPTNSNVRNQARK
jgi:hypothetical protein